ncbi:MAG: LacI family DNA-binding transcriptional regulator [Opitutaceae bacterium]
MNLRHLARLAKLSPSAVSLALRGSAKISAATKKHVRELAEKHDYKPDAKLAALMSGLRKTSIPRQTACFGVISLYAEEYPWDKNLHLKRVYDGMSRRAAEIGYRLEPIWLRAPGMTYRRFRGILDARGIEGLLCFGSPVLEDDFPIELDHYAVVTIGLSIRTPLHRVTNHFYNDTVSALDRLHHLGYRRPGLVMGRYEDSRAAHIHTAAYLGWCDRTLGLSQAVATLQLDRVEEAPLMAWLKLQRPDAILFVHLYDMLPELQAVLKKNRVRVPADLGVAVLTQILDRTQFSGMRQNQSHLGAWAVELLAARIANRDFGIPGNPRIEMVESEWIDGRSLRTVNS